MGLRIQNNVEAFNTHRQLTATSSAASKSMEKLSSGYRINRAADDAAGLAISEKMRGQIGGLAQAQRNAQDGISLVQTAEGALTEVHSMLQRVRDLKVQSLNDTLRDRGQGRDRGRGHQLGTEISKIGSDTAFNGTKLLDAAATLNFQVGANDGETIADQRDQPGRRLGRLGWSLGGAPTAPPLAAVDDLRHRRRDQGRLHRACRLRRGAEPPRASPEQPGDLPGEPDRFRVAYPRRRHGGGDDQVHEARTSCSRPARACSRRPTRRPQGVLSLLR